MASFARRMLSRRQAPHQVRDDWWLVVGLGNPGVEYAATRHNVGFWVADRVAARARLKFTQKKCESRIAEGEYAGQGLAIARPGAYMNRSGMAVKGLVQRYRVPLDRLIIVVDDINLPIGRVRIRTQGRAGGHNGLKSIMMYLTSDTFPRIRIGIGLPEGTPDLRDHVLSTFDSDEEPIVAESCDRAADAVLTIIELGIDTAMNRFNSDPQEK
jgi:PTH1 family peptidyl-tRNA hydrolase